MKEKEKPEYVSTNEEENIREVHHYHHDKPEYMRIFTALDLITIGIVLLLNTTGVIGWKIWVELLRFWPLFIVSAGIGIIFSFSNWGKVIGKIITYLLFLAMLFFAGVNTITGSTLVDNFRNGLPNFLTSSWFVFNTGNNDQVKETNYLKSEYPTVNSVLMDMTFGKGDVLLTDLASDNTILNVNASYSKYDSAYTISNTTDNSKQTVNFDSGKGYEGLMFFSNSAPKYQINFNNELIDSVMNIKLGAGEVRMDLTKIGMNYLTANTGAGKLVATFTSESLPKAMKLEVGAGEMVLTMPKDAGYKLKYQVGVGEVSVDGKEVGVGLGSNNILMSDNYSAATSKIEIDLNVGVGSFKLVLK